MEHQQLTVEVGRVIFLAYTAGQRSGSIGIVDYIVRGDVFDCKLFYPFNCFSANNMKYIPGPGSILLVDQEMLRVKEVDTIDIHVFTTIYRLHIEPADADLPVILPLAGTHQVKQKAVTKVCYESVHRVMDVSGFKKIPERVYDL